MAGVVVVVMMVVEIMCWDGNDLFKLESEVKI